MGTWAGANGGLRQVTVPCLHEWELGHMAKKHGRRFSRGGQNELRLLWAGCVFLFLDISTSQL